MVFDAAGDNLSTAMSVILQVNQQVEISALIGDGDFGSKDVDLFRVSLEAGQSLQIDVDAKALDNNVALSSLDSYLRVFSSTGIQLATNSSGTSRNDSYASTLGSIGLPPDAYLVFKASSTGDYFIGVSGESNGYSMYSMMTSPGITSPGITSPGITTPGNTSSGNKNYNPNVSGSGVDSSTGSYKLQLTVDAAVNRSVSIADATGYEDAGALAFVVSLNQASSQTVTLNYATSNDTASSGMDYSAVSGSLVFAPGELSKTIYVPIVDDSDFNEPTNETIFVNLSNLVGASLADGLAIGTIINNDFPTGDLPGDSLALSLSVPLVPNILSELNASIGDGSYGAKDVDLFRVSLVAGQTLRIDVDATLQDNGQPLSSLDGYLRVFNAAGDQLASNSSASSSNDAGFDADTVFGRPFDPYLEFQATATGNYFIGVSGESFNYYANSSNGNISYNPNVPGSGVASSTGAYKLQLLTNPPPAVSISTSNQLIFENAFTVRVPVNLSYASSSTVRVDYTSFAGTASSPTDYSQASGTLVFNPGETSKYIDVSIANDQISEMDETFELRLSNPVNGQLLSSSSLITIQNDDPDLPGDSIASARLVTLSPGLLVESNEMIGDGVYRASDVDLYRINLAIGQVIKIDVDAKYSDDNSSTSTLDSYLRIFNSSGTQLTANSTGTSPNDLPYNSSVSGPTPDSYLVFQAPSAGEYFIGVSGETYNFTSGVSNGNVNYNPNVAGSGVTSTLGSYKLQLLAEPPPIPTISSQNLSVLESAGTIRVPVMLSMQSDSVVRVDYMTFAGTAKDTSDFTQLAETIIFSPGETDKFIDIAITNDQVSEMDETFEVQFSNPINGQLITSSSLVTIQNDDPDVPGDALTTARSVVITPGTLVEINEMIGDGLYRSSDVDLFRIELAAGQRMTADLDAFYADNGVAISTLDGRIRIFDSIGTDITPGSINRIGSGTSSNDFVSGNGIASVDDYIDFTPSRPGSYYVGISSESNKAYNATIANSGSTTSSPAAIGVYRLQMLAGIAPVPTLSLSQSAFREDAGSTSSTVRLSYPSLQTISVSYTAQSGTALSPSDYAFVPGTLVFEPGTVEKTIPITVVNDNDFEGNETFQLILSNAVNAPIEAALTEVSIVDDEPNPIRNVQLVFDTGLNREDRRTVNPQIQGQVVGNFGDSTIRIEFDHNSDGIQDGFANLATSQVAFVYDPRTSDQTLVDFVGNVPMRYRFLMTQADGRFVETSWTDFAFVMEAIPASAYTVTNLTHSNGGAVPDLPGPVVTVGMHLLGRVNGVAATNVASVPFAVPVEFDLDMNGTVDVTTSTSTDSVRAFAKYFARYATRQHIIQARALEWNVNYGMYLIGQWTSYSFYWENSTPPSVLNLRLLNDTGVSQSDLTTQDPRIAGEFSAPFRNVAGVVAEYDLDSDGVANGQVDVDDDAKFLIAPVGLVGGYRTIAVRSSARDQDTAEIKKGPWRSLSFTYEPIPLPDIQDLQLLVDDGISSSDRITTNATLGGKVAPADGKSVTVYFDFNDDGTADMALKPQQDGQFVYNPLQLLPGSYTISVWASRFSDIFNRFETGSKKSIGLTIVAKPVPPLTVTQLKLVEDTGTNKSDFVTSNPAITGKLVQNGNVARAKIEIDTNADGIVDGTTTTDDSGDFQFTPTRLANGPVSIAVRGVVYNPVTSSLLQGPWSNLSFSLVASTNEAPVISSLRLLNDTGIVADLRTKDHRITGQVLNDSSVEGLLVEVDMNGDGIADRTANTDSQGRFIVNPSVANFGPVTLRSRAIEFDTKTSSQLASPWASLSFVFENQIDGPPITSELSFDPGNFSTGKAPSLSGMVSFQQGSSGIQVEVDSNNDGNTDYESITDNFGRFTITLEKLAPNTTSIKVHSIASHPTTKQLFAEPWQSFAINYTVTTPPAAFIVGLSLAEDTGTSATDRITSNPKIKGSVNRLPVGRMMLVEIDTNGDSIADGTSLVASNLQWSFTPTGLSDGAVNIAARTHDTTVDGQTLLGTWSGLAFTLQADISGSPDGNEKDRQDTIIGAQGQLNESRNAADGVLNRSIDSANRAQESSVKSAETQFQQDTALASNALDVAQAAAAAAFQIAMASYSGNQTSFAFDPLSWPDAPKLDRFTLPADSTMPKPPSYKPDYRGPSFEFGASPNYQAAIASANATYQMSVSDANSTRFNADQAVNDAYTKAVDTERDRAKDARKTAQDVYKSTIEAAPSFDASSNAYNSALDNAERKLRNDTWVAARQRDSEIQLAADVAKTIIGYAEAAWTSYYNSRYSDSSWAGKFLSKRKAYNQAVYDAKFTFGNAVIAAYQSFDQAVADAGNLSSLAQNTAAKDYNDALATHDKELRGIKINATITLEKTLATIQRDTARANANAAHHRDKQLATNVKTELLALEQAKTIFIVAEATTKVAALSAWDSALATPWTAYQLQLAANRRNYVTTLRNAQIAHAQSVADAEKVRSDAVADAKRQAAYDFADKKHIHEHGYSNAKSTFWTETSNRIYTETNTIDIEGKTIRDKLTNIRYTRELQGRNDNAVYSFAKNDAGDVFSDTMISALSVEYGHLCPIDTVLKCEGWDNAILSFQIAVHNQSRTLRIANINTYLAWLNAYRTASDSYVANVEDASTNKSNLISEDLKRFQETIAGLDRDYSVAISTIEGDENQAIAAAQVNYVLAVAPADEFNAIASAQLIGVHEVQDANGLATYRVSEANTYASQMRSWNSELDTPLSAMYASQGSIEIAWANATGAAEIAYASAMQSARNNRETTIAEATRLRRTSLSIADRTKSDSTADLNDAYVVSVASAKQDHAIAMAGFSMNRTQVANNRINARDDNERQRSSSHFARLQSDKATFQLSMINVSADYGLADILAPRLNIPAFNSSMASATIAYNTAAKSAWETLRDASAAWYGESQQYSFSSRNSYEHSSFEPVQSSDDQAFTALKGAEDKILADAILTAKTTLANGKATAEKNYVSTVSPLDAAYEVTIVQADNTLRSNTSTATTKKNRELIISNNARREDEIAAQGVYETASFQAFATMKVGFASASSSPRTIAESNAAAADAIWANAMRIARDAYEDTISAAGLFRVERINDADLAYFESTNDARFAYTSAMAWAESTYQITVNHARTDVSNAEEIGQAKIDKELVYASVDYENAAAVAKSTRDAALGPMLTATLATLGDTFKQYFFEWNGQWYDIVWANVWQINPPPQANWYPPSPWYNAMGQNLFWRNGTLATDLWSVYGEKSAGWDFIGRWLESPNIRDYSPTSNYFRQMIDIQNSFDSSASSVYVNYANAIGEADKTRATRIGDANIAHADSRGTMGLGLATIINQAESMRANASMNAASTQSTQLANANRSRANTLSQATRYQTVAIENAKIGLTNLEQTASIVRATSIASAEANYQIATADQESAGASSLAAGANSPSATYAAIYAQAKASWIFATAPAYVNHAAAVATAEGQANYTIAFARASRNISHADSDQAFAELQANQSQILAIASLAASNSRLSSLLTLENSRRLSTSTRTQTYERDVAIAEKTLGLDNARAFKQQQIDRTNKVAIAIYDATYKNAVGDAKLTLDMTIADRKLAWSQAETNDQETFTKTSTQLHHAYSKALIGLEQAYQIQMANAEQTQQSIHTNAEAAFFVAKTTAENTKRSNTSSAVVGLWNSRETARIAAHTSIDNALQLPWSRYLVDAAIARAGWWNTASVQYASLAADRNNAETTHTGRLATAHAIRQQEIALANKSKSMVEAGAQAAEATSKANSVRDYFSNMTSPTKSYADAMANAERQKSVAIAQANRAYVNHRSESQRKAQFDAADNAYKATKTSSDLAYRSTLATRQADQFKDFATADFNRTVGSIAGDVAAVTARNNAEKSYRTVESEAGLQSATAWANMDAIYRQYEANSFALAAASLATNAPSPWASYDANNYAATAANVTTLSNAAKTNAIAQSVAQRTAETSQVTAETIWQNVYAVADGTFKAAWAGANLALAGSQAALYSRSEGATLELPSVANVFDLNSEYTVARPANLYEVSLYNVFAPIYQYRRSPTPLQWLAPFVNYTFMNDSERGYSVFRSVSSAESIALNNAEKQFNDTYWQIDADSAVDEWDGLLVENRYSNSSDMGLVTQVELAPGQFTKVPPVDTNLASGTKSSNEEVISLLKDLREGAAELWTLVGSVNVTQLSKRLGSSLATLAPGLAGSSVTSSSSISLSPSSSDNSAASKSMSVVPRKDQSSSAVALELVSQNGALANIEQELSAQDLAKAKEIAVQTFAQQALVKAIENSSTEIVQVIIDCYRDNAAMQNALIMVLQSYQVVSSDAWWSDYWIDHENRKINVSSTKYLGVRSADNIVGELEGAIRDDQQFYKMFGLWESWEGMSSRIGFGLVETVGGGLSVLGGVLLVVAPEPTMLTKAGGGIAVTFGSNAVVSGISSFGGRETRVDIIGSGLEKYYDVTGVDQDLRVWGHGALLVSNITSGFSNAKANWGTIKAFLTTSKAFVQQSLKSFQELLHSGKSFREIAKIDDVNALVTQAIEGSSTILKALGEFSEMIAGKINGTEIMRIAQKLKSVHGTEIEFNSPIAARQ